MDDSGSERLLSRAFVRPPGDSFVRAISSSTARIDVALAQRQHAEYCQALAAAGLSVESLPVDEHYPDSCFMQDPAVVLGGRAVVCRMGAPSRRGEEEAVAAALAERGFAPERIAAPGTLEGGDVLMLPGRVWVGETERSNREGILQLAAILGPAGLPVSALPVPGYLHLLSVVTYLGQNTVLALPGFAGHPAFAGMDVIVVPDDECYAVNTLAIGATAIVPAGYPQIARAIAERGFQVLPVPTTEFAKADGGVTCLSLVY